MPHVDHASALAATAACRVALPLPRRWSSFALSASPAQAIDDFFPTFGNHWHRRAALRRQARRRAQLAPVVGRAVLTVQATKRLDEILARPQRTRRSAGARSTASPRATARRPASLRSARPRPIAKGKRFKVAVDYRGVPKTIPDPTADDPGSIPGLGWTNFADSSYVVSEPVGAGTWYPVNDEPTDKATYRFAVDGGQALYRRRQRRAAVRSRIWASGGGSSGNRRSRWRAIWRSSTSTGTVWSSSMSASGVPIRNYLDREHAGGDAARHCARPRP